MVIVLGDEVKVNARLVALVRAPAWRTEVDPLVEIYWILTVQPQRWTSAMPFTIHSWNDDGIARPVGFFTE